MDKFQIKYLWELYPNTDFTEEFVVCQSIVEKNNSVENQATSEKWADIRSSTMRQRLIQTFVYREYELKIVVSRNIGVPILEYADYITVTQQLGFGSGVYNETFQIYDVKATYSKVAGSKDYIIELTFKREETGNVINHLSSDNILSYKTEQSEAVNEIQYDVNNPSYSFNNVSFYTYEYTGDMLAGFKVPLTDLTNTILVNDTYYLHTDSPTYNEYQDDLDQYLNFAKCISKDTDYVYFRCSDSYISHIQPAPDIVFIVVINIILDHEAGGTALPTSPDVITVADKTISLAIYTALEPVYSHKTVIIKGRSAPDGIEENQKTIEKDVINLKCWLKIDELYKAEYLNYALNDDILISLANYTDIVPVQTEGIITLKDDNKNLIDLFEYDIEVLYNNKTVNINR